MILDSIEWAYIEANLDNEIFDLIPKIVESFLEDAA